MDGEARMGLGGVKSLDQFQVSRSALFLVRVTINVPVVFKWRKQVSSNLL